jgi:hypothetical protein
VADHDEAFNPSREALTRNAARHRTYSAQVQCGAQAAGEWLMFSTHDVLLYAFIGGAVGGIVGVLFAGFVNTLVAAWTGDDD